MYDCMLLEQVLDKYGLPVVEYSIISNKEKKKVWKVKFSGGSAALKKMPGTPEKTFFLARSVDFLAGVGVKVAPVIPTAEGSLFVNIKKDTFLLSRWIDGKQPDYDRNLELILESMARFHLGSRGFQPGEGYIRSHLGTWLESFAKKKKKLEQLKEIAHENYRDSFSRIFLQFVDHFIESVALAEKKLVKSCYRDWIKRLKKELCLCHQDFTPKNLRLSAGELYVFDIDSITVDLPARDIRKIINKLMKKKGWDKVLLNQVSNLYRKNNPISDSEWQVVLIDLYFPHLFWGIVTKYYGKRAPDWPKEKFLKRLDEMVKVELSKEKILADLI
ncbi:CotS family spore coat protein [Desulfolucanica intricata]|uniref:CotS family spore coat protein n=1 Tax=Desulfolucanica intricata TaxID=1285191 RepID=UPI00082A6AEC|nr:CotS family spore coat protein [Desulfolucanica intricata]